MISPNNPKNLDGVPQNPQAPSQHGGWPLDPVWRQPRSPHGPGRARSDVAKYNQQLNMLVNLYVYMYRYIYTHTYIYINTHTTPAAVAFASSKLVR